LYNQVTVLREEALSMLILSIDTAGRRVGAALVDGDEVLGTRSSIGPHSAALLPMVSELLASQDVEPAALDLIGVARGPGTYTGLRVGVVTAKVLGRAADAAVVGVPTLDAMARHAPESSHRVLVVLHAYKRRVLSGWYERDDRGLLVADEVPRLTTVDDAPRAGRGEVVITDAEALLPDLERWGADVPVFEDASVFVAHLARERWLKSATDETYSLVPDYLKPPSITLKADTKTEAS